MGQAQGTAAPAASVDAAAIAIVERTQTQKAALDVSGVDLSGEHLQTFLKSGALAVDAAYQALTALNLSNCALNRVDWLASLPQASTLIDVDISRNRLTSLDGQNELLFFLKHLQRLNLSYNYVVVLPPLFFNLVALQTLNAANNNIDTIHIQFEYLDHLTDLDLSCNQLKQLPGTIGACPNLLKLKLNQNKLSSLPDSIGDLHKLVQLSLSDNFLRTVPPSMANLTALRKLYLDNNEIEDLQDATFAKMIALRELFVNQNRLTTLPAAIGALPELSLIDVSDNLFIPESPLARASNIDVSALAQAILEHQLFTKSAGSTSRRQQRQQQRAKKTGRDTLRLLPSPNTIASVSQIFETPAAPQHPVKRDHARPKLFRFAAIDNTDYVVVDRLALGIDEFNFTFGAFLLDIPSHPDAAPVLLIWIGEHCNPREAAKAQFVARTIASDTYAELASIVTLEYRAHPSWTSPFPRVNNISVPTASPIALFASQFGVFSEKEWKQFEKSSRATNTNRDAFTRRVIDYRVEFSRLWKFDCAEDIEDGSQPSSGDSGNVQISIVGGDGVPMSKTCLESSSVFVVDCAGQHGRRPAVWVWCGHFADANSRTWALLKAEQLIKSASGDESENEDVELLWNIDGAEMWDFRELFWDWDSYEWDSHQKERIQQQRDAELQQRIELEAEMQAIAASQAQKQKALTLSEESTYLEQMSNVKLRNSDEPLELERKDESLQKTDLVSGEQHSASDQPVAETTQGPSMRRAAKKRSTQNNKADQLAALPTPDEATVAVDARRVDPLQSVAQLIPSLPPSPAIPESVGKKIGFFDQAEKLQARSLTEATAVAGVPSAAERRANFSRGLSAFNIGNKSTPNSTEMEYPTDSSAPRLAGPKRAAAPTGRRAATSNPVRQRANIQQQSESQNTTDRSAEDAARRESNLRAAGGGMMGFGSGIMGAAEARLRVQREKADGIVEPSRTISSEDAFARKGLPRLLHIKGRRKIIVRQVKTSWSSLNNGDVFILDNGKGLLYQWNGKNANRIEKGKGMDVCKNIKDKELMGNGKVIVLEEGASDSTEQATEFWSILSGIPRPEIATAESAGDDNDVDEDLKEFTNLFKIVSTVESSPTPTSAPTRRPRTLSRQQSVAVEVQPELVARYPLKKDILEQEQCYILDCGSELYVWCGGKSSLPVRKQTMKLVEDLRNSRIDQESLWVAPIARELPGGESVLFREKFIDWGYGPPIQMQQIAVGKNVAKVGPADAVDVLAVHARSSEKQEVVVDDGNGRKKVWRIVDFKKVPVDPSDYGHFHSGDSYIVLYTYPVRNKEAHMIYYWQGTNSTINEKGTSALLTIELGDEIDKGNTKEVRVVMNQEPRHFLLIFKGSYVVHVGKADTQPPSGPALYQIHGYSEPYCKCIQVDSSVNTLESTSCFFAISSADEGRQALFWAGKHATPYELSYAKQVEQAVLSRFSCSSLPKKLTEGSDPAELFKCLGLRRSQFPKSFPVVAVDRAHPVRLFHSSEATGQHKVWEIPPPFAQEDLSRNECFVLDTWFEVFVWSSKASPSDLKKAMEFAVEYADKVPDGRKKNCPVRLVAGGNEPVCFTAFFHGWRPAPAEVDKDLPSVRDELAKFRSKYTFEDLVNKNYPAGIDSTKLEEYLADDEFVSVFGVSREEFAKLPGWKQQKEKRDRKLF